MAKKYNLKNDVIFKAFFSKKGNEKYLIDFLESLLKIKIKTIKITEEVNLEKLGTNEKGGRLDLQAILNNGIIINIEMQVRKVGNISKRSMYYSAKTIARETEIGTLYKDIKNIISINILDYEITGFEEYISETAIVLKDHREYEMGNDMKWYYIELPKFRKSKKNMKEKINQWLAFIDDEDRRLIEMAKESNEKIKEAEKEVEYLTGDEEIKRLVWLREKWEMDRVSEIETSREEGISEGISQGSKEEKVKIAKQALKMGLEIDKIEKLTGLTKKEIEKLK